MNTFAIGIPTLNRYDLLKDALEKYYIDFPNTKIFIVDNGNQSIDDSHQNVQIYKSHKNLGVAGSWNKLCNLIYEEHSHALILNDDIQFSKQENEISHLINSSDFDFYVGPYYWSVYILPKTTFYKVGGFDEEFFPAYFEDNSFSHKLKLNNCSYFSTEVLLPTLCRNSMTLEKDPTVNSTFEKLKKLYVKMWGGKPGEEKYITKFNENLKIS